MKKKTKKTILYTLAIIVVCWMLSNIVWKTKAYNTLGMIRESGYPATCEDMDKYYEEIPCNPITADLYKDAFKEYSITFEDKESEGIPFFSKTEVADMDLEKTKQLLEANKQASDLLRLGVASGECKFPLEFDDGYMMLIDHLSNIRNGVRLLVLESVANNSYESMMTAWKFSDSIKNEPVLISYLVRVASQSLVLENLEHIDLTADQKLAFIEAIEKSEDNQFEMSFVGERCFASLILTMSYKESKAMDNGGEAGPALYTLSKGIALPHMNYITMAEYFDKYIENARLPLEERDIDGLEEAVENESFVQVYVKILMPALSKIFELEEKHIGITQNAIIELKK
jgi:hypothetical protein